MNDSSTSCWHATQLTEEQAIALAATKWWHGATPRQIVLCQLWQPRTCMDFGDFQIALSEVLGRSVFTHELVHVERLQREVLGEQNAPTFEEVIDMLPEHLKANVLAVIAPAGNSSDEGLSSIH